jgi:hypothetical protein
VVGDADALEVIDDEDAPPKASPARRVFTRLSTRRRRLGVRAHRCKSVRVLLPVDDAKVVEG